MKIAVLGVGRVGKAVALDLAREGEFDVTAVDRSEESLARIPGDAGINTLRADLADTHEVARALGGQDLAVGAVPGFLGFRTLQAVLEAGYPVVDMAFAPEDPMQLNGLARQQGLVAVVDAGIAPGMSNLILGRLEEELDETTRFECMVGGLPVVRHWPFQYKAPFSPVDVLEEYTRPARLRRNGRTRVVPALSDVEMLDLPEVGALEAFNTDGLRTLLKTCETPNMVEKTLRYPGHAEWMKGLRASGFFRSEAMDVDGDTVVPLKLTGKLLEEAWAFDESEEDLTIMRLVVDGVRDGKEERHSFHLLDRYDSETGTSSMARTTGYTCTAMVRAVAQGLYREPGVSPLELVGREKKVYDFVMDELKARGVEFQHSVQEVEEG